MADYTVYWLQPPPPPVDRRRRKPAPRMVKLSTLPADQKRLLWERIKTTEPELANGMRDNPFLRAVRERFNGEFVLPEDKIRELLS